MEFDALKDVDDVDVLEESLTNAIHKSAESTLTKIAFNSNAKPYWRTQVKEAHPQAQYLMRLWLADRRPRGRNHKTFSDYKDAKTRFRRIQRNESEKYSNKVCEGLNMTAGLDPPTKETRR